MISDWMLKLRERNDHHARLMPYALSALSDPSAKVQQAALKILDDLGAQWVEEHKEDLKVPTRSLYRALLLNNWQELAVLARPVSVAL